MLNGSANALLRGVGIEPKEELSGARSAEELSSLVRRSASAGLLEQDTATLLGRTLRFADHDASDVMTPRPRVAAVQRQEPAEAVLELARQTGYSRFPVYDENLDDIVGIVHVKQAVAVPRERRAEVPASALQSEALRVPETMQLDMLLGELRGRGYQMAIVVDEYGGTAGVATLEDLVEELVGEVADEHDRTRAGIVRRGDVVSFPGILRPDELLERTGIRVPENGDYETVGGFVMTELGRLPVVGDEVLDRGRHARGAAPGRPPRSTACGSCPRPCPTTETRRDRAGANDERLGRNRLAVRAAHRERLLRRRRVRRHLRAPLADRAARRAGPRAARRPRCGRWSTRRSCSRRASSASRSARC